MHHSFLPVFEIKIYCEGNTLMTLITLYRLWEITKTRIILPFQALDSLFRNFFLWRSPAMIYLSVDRVVPPGPTDRTMTRSHFFVWRRWRETRRPMWLEDNPTSDTWISRMKRLKEFVNLIEYILVIFKEHTWATDYHIQIHPELFAQVFQLA